MSEIDKLYSYLLENGYHACRNTANLFGIEQNQILVVDSEGNYLWDAICHQGSYGYEDGLLEIMGEIVDPSCEDDVEGWLTADDVIARVKEKYEKD